LAIPGSRYTSKGITTPCVDIHAAVHQAMHTRLLYSVAAHCTAHNVQCNN